MNNKHKNLVKIILLTLLGVLMFVSQVVMAALPNIEIVSLLIILTARKFGPYSLVSVYIFAFCEIVTYGFGIWSVNYLYVWTILCFAVLLIRKINDNLVFTVVSGIFGLLFGTFCSIPYFITGGFAAGLSYIAAGLGFDFIHCVGNIVAALVLQKPLQKVFEKINL